MYVWLHEAYALQDVTANDLPQAMGNQVLYSELKTEEQAVHLAVVLSWLQDK